MRPVREAEDRWIVVEDDYGHPVTDEIFASEKEALAWIDNY